MKRFGLVGGGIVAILAVALPAAAQPKDSAAALPVTRIVLFSSGVSYFQRDGQVEGNARVDLRFPTSDINDLLKSLTLQDLGGGQVGTVSYDNRNPIAMTLKSFALDLTQNPSMGELLNQARGERVQVAQGTQTLTGVIVGVEKIKQPVGKDQAIDVEQMNLLTDDGLLSVALPHVSRIRFLKSQLQQEFHKALEVLAAGHDKQKKTVSLNFTGQGQRAVRVGYVTESPVWKNSYRLELQKDKVALQGWAMVENTTDEDWKDVRLGLVSGRPISFRMDLYEPLFAPRPLVEMELYASLRPQTYGGDMLKEEARRQLSENGAAPSAPALARMRAMPRSADGAGGGGRRDELMAKSAAGLDSAADKFGALGRGVASAASAAELGEFFQYAIKQPISLQRQKSALIPIVQEDVTGARVSIYNEGVQAKFPLLGLRFTNSTPLHLAQGPVTVFDNNAYAGDARIADMQPKETRLISYAIDLGTEVEPKKAATDSLMTLKVFKGILHATYKLRETKSYTVKNRSEHARTVLVEHPYRPEFHLVTPTKPTEKSRDVYRFELMAEPNKPVTLEIVEELPRLEQIALTNMDDEQVRFYIRTNAASDALKTALARALELKAKVNESAREREREEQALKLIEQDQARMRANMQRVPPTSEAYKRYLKKFDEQETEIERRQARMAKLQEAADQQRKAYDDYLANLNVE